MNVDEFTQVLGTATARLDEVTDADWSQPAGTLEWSCWQTVDHVIDCVFSYALQLAARSPSDLLPFHELHALATATPRDLVQGLDAVGKIFAAVVRSVPADATAADGVLQLGPSDWCARAAYEISLHTYDVLSGLGHDFAVPHDTSAAILASPSLWMLDRELASSANPWTALVLGSGRPMP
jgi:DinB family protein